MPLKCKKCKDTGVVTTWERSLEFNPASPLQVKALFHALHLKLPLKRGENRETTEAKYLKRLGKRFPVFRSILEVRRRNKLLSDYLWPSDAEGTIRTTFGFHPSTWRKSSRGPNLQVIPRISDESDLPQLVRETITAPPGYLLMEADSEGIEAVLVAYDVVSERMMKVAKAGIHGYFLSHVLGEPIDWRLPFVELRAACKAVKKREPFKYDQCKRVVHGTHYGLTPYGMADEYEEMFTPGPHDKERTAKAMAEKLQGAYLALFPELQEWMKRIRQQAYTQRYLDNHFQYRHYFYDTFTWDSKRGQYVLGSDGKRCIAFRPQSDGSACQSEYMLKIEELAEAGDERYQLLRDSLRLLIHDSLVFCIPEAAAGWAPQAIADVMNMSFAELGGLQIGVEVKMGRNMGQQKTVPVRLAEWKEAGDGARGA